MELSALLRKEVADRRLLTVVGLTVYVLGQNMEIDAFAVSAKKLPGFRLIFPQLVGWCVLD